MELKEFLALFRRRVWLLVLGLLVGLLGGYLASYYMEPVYEASSKLMISREVQEINPDFIGLSGQQLVQTYIQILKAKSLIDTTSERVGTEVASEQILVRQIPDTQIIEITVEDRNPDRVALIANTIAIVLIEQDGKMQTGQYTSMEDHLAEQVVQVKAQIDTLQSEYDQAYKLDYQAQLSKLDEQIVNTQTELSSLQIEIAALNSDYRQADKLLEAEKQVRVDQLQSLSVIYEQLRANMLILGRPVEYSTREVTPQMQQLQRMIELYQSLYLTHIEDLERMRLDRLGQTPNIILLEMATLPKKPVRPIPLLYTLLSGVVGVMLTVGLVFFIEALRDEQAPPEEVEQVAPDKKKGKRTKKAA